MVTETDERKNPIREVAATCRGALFAAGLFSFGVNMLMLTVPIYMMQVFDRVLGSKSVETLILLTVVASGAFVILGMLEVARARVMQRIGARIEVRLSDTAFNASIASALKTGQASARALQDLTRIRTFLGGSGVLSLFDAPWTPVFIFIIYLFHPYLGTIALIGAVLIFSLALINEMATRRPYAESAAASHAANRLADASVRNADVVEGMGMQGGVVQRWANKSGEALALQLRGNARNSVASGMARSLRMMVQIGVLGMGAYLTMQREITPGVMIGAVLLMARALAPVQAAISGWRELVSTREAYRRLKEQLGSFVPRDVAMTLPAPKGELQAEKLVYYPPGSSEAILRGINFSIEAGESLAVVGPTAAGKSTLAKLIVGSWQPSWGNVRLDGADVYTWNRTDFGRYVGYVPQDIELFSGSVKENIARFSDVESDAIVAAAKLARVHDLILHLPEGYETEIGDNGEALSGGQRQRIALARALLGPPQLLVLDEPNANLDTEGEAALMQTLVEAKELGITVVLIAHRPSLLTSVDKVLVLRNGQVEMFGPREEVLSRVARPGRLREIAGGAKAPVARLTADGQSG